MDSNEWDKKWKELPGRRRVERDDYTVFHVFKNGEKIATLTGKGLAGERKVEYFGEYKNPKNQVSVEAFMMEIIKGNHNSELSESRYFHSELDRLDNILDDMRNEQDDDHGIYGDCSELEFA